MNESVDRRIRSTVEAYVERVGSGTGAEIAALYADDATLEDPVGSEPKVGRAAITAFYEQIEPMRRSTELLAVRVAGDSAAFHFRIVTTAPEGAVDITPIDVMTFDGEGRVTSMRAYWAPQDARFTPAGQSSSTGTSSGKGRNSVAGSARRPSWPR